MPTANYECSHVEQIEDRVDDNIEADTPEDAARAYRDRHGFWPQYVDTDEVTICEACEAVVIGDDYMTDEEGDLKFCRSCGESGR